MLRRYRRGWLRSDVYAGISVVAYLVPQVMAYTALVGVPPVAGLWTALAALIVYAALGLVAGAVGRSRVDDRPDGRHGDRTAGRSRPGPGGGVGRRAQPDRRRVVPGRPTGPPRRDRRPALPAAARRLSRRCGRADGRRAAGQDDRHDRRGRQPRRSAPVLRRGRRRHPPADPRGRRGNVGPAAGDPLPATALAGDPDRRRRGHRRVRAGRPEGPRGRGGRRGPDRAADARPPRRDVGGVPDAGARRARDRGDRLRRQHADRPRLPGAGRRRTSRPASRSTRNRSSPPSPGFRSQSV